MTSCFIHSRNILVNLLVKHFYAVNKHYGLSQFVAEYHSVAWKTNLRFFLESLSQHCVAFRKDKANALRWPDPPPLPAIQVTLTQPFSPVGVDHLGHFQIHLPLGERGKIYIFACTVPMQFISKDSMSLSATDFLMAICRFVAAHGLPS